MTNPAQYTLISEQIVDLAFSLMNTRLSGLSWLTKYGPAQKLTKEVDGRTYNYPGIYVGGAGKGDYLDMLPDAHLATFGGYSFWDLDEPIRKTEYGTHEIKAALVVWFDFRKIYPADWQGRSVWNVVHTVTNALSTGTGAASMGDEMAFYYSGESIYPRYSHREINRQFLMKPYGGFRIEGTIFLNNLC